MVPKSGMVTHELVSVEIDGDKVVVDWSDNLKQAFTPAYLKYSPGFPGHNRPAGPEGRFPLAARGLVPHKSVIDDTGNLKVEWHPGNETSLHESSWLRQQAEKLQSRSQKTSAQQLWNAETISNLPERRYQTLVGSESVRLELSEQLLNWGVALVRDVPAEPDQIETIAGWFGQISPNPYADDPARGLSSIRVDPAVPVATHMSHFLGPHTDTCWRQTLIGLLLMHCLDAHPDSGRSMLVDGFAIAERLRSECPESFELLATIPLSFDALVADRDDWRVQGRVISVAADGVIEGIRYNGNSIGQLDLPDNLIESVYHALEDFEALLFDRDLWWQPKLQPGDLLIIDNHRVLHGREAFDPAVGERHIRCCGVERDDFYNNYRREAKRLGAKGWDRRLSAGVI
jgi:gamma-butyrobetaine dioxygenase